MNRIKKTKYFKIVYAIILNISICLLMILFIPTLYSLADEREFVQLITDGYYNISFTNYYLCILIGAIQNIIYPLNAFVIVHLLLSLISFIAITRVLLDRLSILFSTCGTLVLFGFFAINHYVTVSFSLLPSLLTITGFLCIIHYANRVNWVFGVIFGSVLAVLGSMYRFSMFEMSCAVAAFFIVGKSVSEFFSIKKGNRKSKELIIILFEKKRLITCILVLVISFSINIASNYINTSTTELMYYKQYSAARSAVWDYPIPDYETCKEEYDAIGIDKNDIEMLRVQYLDDEGAFPLETLYKIKDIKSANDKVKNPVLQVLKEMIVSELGNIKAVSDKGVVCIAGGIVLIAFLLIMKKRTYFIPACLMIITALDYSYLWIIGRPVFRGVYMTWLGMIVFLLYSISYSELRDYAKRLYDKKSCVVKTALVIGCLLFSASGLYLSNIGNFTDGNAAPASKDNTLLEYIESDSSKKYEIARDSGFIYNPQKDIYLVTKRNPNQNFLFNKGTYYKHPYYIEVFKDFGTDNYYSNLLNDNVYYVDSSEGKDTEMMQKYLQKYYSDGKTVTVEKVDSISDFNIFKFDIE